MFYKKVPGGNDMDAVWQFHKDSCLIQEKNIIILYDSPMSQGQDFIKIPLKDRKLFSYYIFYGWLIPWG